MLMIKSARIIPESGKRYRSNVVEKYTAKNRHKTNKKRRDMG